LEYRALCGTLLGFAPKKIKLNEHGAKLYGLQKTPDFCLALGCWGLDCGLHPLLIHMQAFSCQQGPIKVILSVSIKQMHVVEEEVQVLVVFDFIFVCHLDIVINPSP